MLRQEYLNAAVMFGNMAHIVQSDIVILTLFVQFGKAKEIRKIHHLRSISWLHDEPMWKS